MRHQKVQRRHERWVGLDLCDLTELLTVLNALYAALDFSLALRKTSRQVGAKPFQMPTGAKPIVGRSHRARNSTTHGLSA